MTQDDLAAQLLHLHAAGLSKGAPVAPQIQTASMFHLPGEPDESPYYGRVDNATWVALEATLAHLEAAPCLCFPSGMGAISAALLASLRAGDQILLPSDGYYATRVLADRFLATLGIEIETRPTAQFDQGGFDGFRLVFVETPSNPGLDLCDIAATAQAVHAAGGLMVVDNTTMTPYGQRPLDLGADIVVASDTKAPNGHSDLLMGHVATRDPVLFEAVKDWRKLSGAIPGPFEAWLTLRGLETLELRLSRMVASAEVIAERLAEHPAVSDLRYPGLSNHPARRQMANSGFLISLTLADAARAERFINDCPMLQPATSFGGVHSSAERRARWGDAVAPGSLRLSVGIEPLESLWAAIADALPAR
ncbi:cystathionine gamma-lyase [Pseudooceanicola sp.]|uniref:cystathionine gamma-lyase n=1 Tax=Pseudooceanicola sp. TaxID=1914328 RepID=UPI002626BFEC|nr:cystathionine gamma-lyase [Pseudooceanicola sp.]MDF1855238.1 cystathionine gamma-lyase [Pseudooceanicola sp.]